MRRVGLLTFLLLLGLSAPADAWMPKPVEFVRAVPPGGAVQAAGARVVTVRTKRRFDLVGASWRGSGRVAISLRARGHSGRWSRWARVEVGGRSTDPVWAGGSDAVQLRLSRPVRRLRLRLINTTGTATAGARAHTAARAKRRGQPGTLPLPRTHAPAPPIVPRAAWGASRCKPRTTPSFGRIQVAFVHHTVSLNSYSRAQSAAVVLGVCLFHRNGNGWNDIGYNFLVDRFGRVFEGRAGGIDQPVLGAQAGGFNAGSTGVSVIGDFSRSRPPAAAMSSLARLLAWKLPLHGVPVLGRTTVVSAGGPSTAYRAGTEVPLQRISGHRDADLTACPGAALFRALPSLRRRVAALAGPVSSLSMDLSAAVVPYGSGPTASGVLTLPDGTPGAGETVELRALSGGRERAVGSATTGVDGSWSATLPPLTRGAVVRAVFAGDGSDARPGVISPVAFAYVAAAISLNAEAPPSGGRVTVSGTVQPAKKRVTIAAYRVTGDGRLRRASSRSAGAGRGSFRAALKLPGGPGTFRLVATTAADSRTAAGRSNEVDVESP